MEGAIPLGQSAAQLIEDTLLLKVNRFFPLFGIRRRQVSTEIGPYGLLNKVEKG